MSTIVALSTAPINSAIHIIRLSGDRAYSIINKASNKKITKEGFKIQLVNIVDNKKRIDEVLVMKFVAPKSFTGEDLIEINCHGGIYLANKIIELLIKHGATLANRGEFSQRAFLNKKITLLQAQAIDNIIRSSSDKGISIANNGLNPKNNEIIAQFSETLFTLIGQVEVNIDYPEYDDVPNIDKKTFINKLTGMKTEIKKIIDISSQVLKFVNGINVAIVGKPNVGKSSLLNAFLNENKAIVSNVPGTTRDIVESKVNIDGVTINFIDTAGIHNKTNNKIEKIGISKSFESIESADLVLLVIDGSHKLDKIDLEILNKIKNKRHLIVSNKNDIKQANNELKSIKISAKKGNIQPLINEIKKEFNKTDIDSYDSVLLQSSNSIGVLKNVYESINEVLNMIKQNKPIDLTIDILHSAYENILNILGTNKDYAFIEKMFSKFCLGK
jgi:tRNA modification GTPase